MNNTLLTSVSDSAKAVSRFAGLFSVLALSLVVSATATDFPNQLRISRIRSLYRSPYLLDITVNLHDENDVPVRLNPNKFGVLCKEIDDPSMFSSPFNPFGEDLPRAINWLANNPNILPISVSETGSRLVTGKKQLKGFVVLDYTRSMLDPVLNGDSNGDLKSDSAEAMESAAKTFLSSLPADAQIGFYEFHRGDAGFPPQKVANLMRDKTYLTNAIDRIWTNVVWTSGATRCWDALHMAISEFPAENPGDDERFLVFLSDGKDESSIHTTNDVVELAQTNAVTIYCVGYGDELTPGPLRDITKQTGGGFYAATNTTNIEQVFTNISDELQSPYILRWATLKRTDSFTPLFQLSLTNSNSVVLVNTTNLPYFPQLYAGNELQGHLRFDTSLEPSNVASLILRASYIPRGVTRLRVNFSTLYPFTVDPIAFDDGGVCPTNWTFTVHQSDGIGYFELSSPTPEDVFTDLPFATLGKLVEFRIQGVTNLTDCFYGLSVDNSLYGQPGGPSLVIDNSYAVSVVSTTPPRGTPTEWLNRYGFTDNLALAEITDHDGDGALTWQEYLAGTNPTNAASVFRLVGATHAPDGCHISFNTESNLVYRLDFSDTSKTWAVLASDLIGDGKPCTVVDPFVGAQRFYRAALTGSTNLPAKLGFIPGGLFTRGDAFNQDPRGEAPTNEVYVSAFFMDQYNVTKEFWDSVKGWALENGYTFDNVGISKAANHPVHTLNWYDAVKWCNARSQKEGLTPCYYADNGLRTVSKIGKVSPFVKWDANGYRLPTEAEWEKAARGGASGHRFPWVDSDNITHAQANYYSSINSFYDTSSTLGFHPTFNDGILPFTSPVGYFEPNDYGLYDMAGNVWNWCWDWYGNYPSGSVTDPRGPNTGSYRVRRGGSWHESSAICQTAKRSFLAPEASYDYVGFRCVRAVTQ